MRNLLIFAVPVLVFTGVSGGLTAQHKGGMKLPAWCKVTPTGVAIDQVGVIVKDKAATVISAERIEPGGGKFGKLTVVLKVPSSEASEVKVTTQPARSDVSLSSVGISTDDGKNWAQLKCQDHRTGLHSAKSLLTGGSAFIGAEGALVRISFTLEMPTPAGAPALGELLKAKIVKQKGFDAVTVPNVGGIRTDMSFDKAEWTPPTADKAGTATLWLSTKNERSGIEIVTLNKGVALKIARASNDPKAEVEDWSEMLADKNPKGSTVYVTYKSVPPVQADAKATAYIRVEFELAKLPGKK